MEKLDDVFEDISEDELYHYGTAQNFPYDPHGSGRYREGSGENPNQHETSFMGRYTELKKSGMTELEIAKAMGCKSTSQLRAQKTIEIERDRQLRIEAAVKLREQGYGSSAIAKAIGAKNESSVRTLLKNYDQNRSNKGMAVAENLKKIVDKEGAVDIGKGVELQLGISEEKLKVSTEILKQQGYNIYTMEFPQVTNPNGNMTTMRILARKDISYDHLKKNPSDIHSVIETAHFEDDGESVYKPFEYPASMDKRRLAVRYADGSIMTPDGRKFKGSSNDPKESGVAKDGVMEIRRGVKDLYMGDGRNYCQARILVDGSHYIKGMAVYSDNLPDGVDVLFNTNKASTVPILGGKNSTVLKPIKNDPTNPFGSAIKENGGQSYYLDPNGKFKNAKGESTSLSLINKRAEEGDWDDWSKQLPSQFLSKQEIPLIRRQLNEAKDDKINEYNEIMSLTNPTVKKELLEEFAGSCDTASVHMQAAALPGQRYQVILPLTTIKDDECYAPNFEDGTKVALVRYPHGGTFEIPILTVNNRNKEGKSIMSETPGDAIGITKSTADRLSGADFDGDTAMVIPLSKNNEYSIKSTKELDGLKGFDGKLKYGPDPDLTYVDDKGVSHFFRNGVEFKPMKKSSVGNEMGKISNLITDMTLQGANTNEIERAVRHSMVVIDAEKHHLDYKQSEIDNGINALKNKYQGHYNENGRWSTGAGTLISQATGDKVVPQYKQGAWYAKDKKIRLVDVDGKEHTFADPETGEAYSRSEVRKMMFDPKTGEKVYSPTNENYIQVTYLDDNGSKVTVDGYKNNEGKIIYRHKGDHDPKGYITVTDEKVNIKEKTSKMHGMDTVSDANLLGRGTPVEKLYAEYANSMKNLANKARLETLVIKDNEYSPSAKLRYAKEVDSLNHKLEEAQLNAPLERQAQLIARSYIQAAVDGDPSYIGDKDRYKKLKTQSLANARNMVNAKRKPIILTEKEWEAIQAGAISKTKLKNIMAHIDTATLKELAMPRQATVRITRSSYNRMLAYKKNGYTTEQIAKAMGLSVSTVSKYLLGKEKAE